MIYQEVKDSDFYGELSIPEQKKYFDRKQKKYLPNIDNIYYTISLVEDFNGNPAINSLLSALKSGKEVVKETHEKVQFFEDLYIDFKSFKVYKYCLSCEDMYDIFILDYLPNKETPRILVQIRSYGLWTKGWEQMLKDSYETVNRLMNHYGCSLRECRENRIDYCFHTNAITSPEKLFSDANLSRTMATTMERYHFTGSIEKNVEDVRKRIKLNKDYFALGERKSNYVFIRFYNKALEVVEMGYKSYFFDRWYEEGLINFYDKFCFEYAYDRKNFNYIHKAKLEFYLQYGKDPLTKREFEIALADKNKKWSDYRDLAKPVMPELTKVMNCEFETKRKFYYRSDKFIDALPMHKRDGSLRAMNRLYKIVDNRGVFLDYMMHDILRFEKPVSQKKSPAPAAEDENVIQEGSVLQNTEPAPAAEKENVIQEESVTYADWWKRLRGVQVNERLTDEKLLREYAHAMDLRLMKRRFIGALAGVATYLGKTKDSSFIEDITDVLSNINDNDKYRIGLSYFDEDGELRDDLESELLEDYSYQKDVRERKYGKRIPENVRKKS